MFNLSTGVYSDSKILIEEITGYGLISVLILSIVVNIGLFLLEMGSTYLNNHYKQYLLINSLDITNQSKDKKLFNEKTKSSLENQNLSDQIPIRL